MKNKCALWGNEVTIYNIKRTVLTQADPITKSEEVSEYCGYDEKKHKYLLTFDWIRNIYKGKLPDLFKEITQGPPDK